LTIVYDDQPETVAAYCHACLTIDYDDQPETVAASLEDAASNLLSQNMYRAVRRWCPKWYTITPND
jgi:hypothetical protein